MILRKKGNDIFAFDTEEELKDFCSKNKQVSVSDFSVITIQKYNKKTGRFDRVKSDRL